jgi:hypothetical protein
VGNVFYRNEEFEGRVKVKAVLRTPANVRGEYDWIAVEFCL